ncbi:hypothetical protein [Caballeronia sp. Lep1P3]|nr:hypothetical protein [Caballeronia sp. Lep1P3]
MRTTPYQAYRAALVCAAILATAHARADDARAACCKPLREAR